MLLMNGLLEKKNLMHLNLNKHIDYLMLSFMTFFIILDIIGNDMKSN